MGHAALLPGRGSLVAFVTAAVLVLVLAACAPTTPAGQPKAPAGTTATTATKPSSQQSGPALRRLRTVTQPDSVRTLAVFRDGSFVTGFFRNDTYQRYDTKSGQPLGAFTVTTKSTPGAVTMASNNSTLAVTPDEKYLLVANYWDNYIAIIDLASHTRVGTIRVGSPFRFISVTNDNGWVMAAAGAIPFNITQQTAGQAIEADDVALSPDGQTAYLLRAPVKSSTSPENAKLVRLDRRSGADQATDLGPVSGYSGGAVRLSPDGQRLYVVLARARLMALDAATGKVLSAVALPLSPQFGPMALSPDGSLLALWATATGTVSTSPAPNPGYVVNEFIFVSGQVTVVETRTLKAVEVDVSGLDGPQDVAFTPDGKYLLVADKFKGVAIYER